MASLHRKSAQPLRQLLDVGSPDQGEGCEEGDREGRHIENEEAIERGEE
jgi:hypothetical protein